MAFPSQPHPYDALDAFVAFTVLEFRDKTPELFLLLILLE